MRRSVTAVVVLSLTLGACAPASAAISPAFRELLTRVAEIEASSISLDVQFDLRELGGPRLRISESGVATAMPAASSMLLTWRGFGHVRSERVRIVGGVKYQYEFDRGLRDGGRPWVEVTQEGVSEPSPSMPEGPFSISDGRPFAGWAATLEKGRSVRDVGTGTVEGQTGTGYFVTLAHEHVSLFVSAAGLPILIVATSHHGRERVSVAEHVIGLDTPLSIPAPPASHVISESQLHQLRRNRHRARSGKQRK